MYQALRNAAACLAFLVGSALIGRLWLVALDTVSLGNAAHGLIFLLLALGLVGSQRLSMVLTALACAPALLNHPLSGEFNIAIIGQYLLFVLCAFLIIIHPRYRSSDKA